MGLFKKLLKVAGPIVGAATGNPFLGAAIGAIGGAADGGGIGGLLGGALGGGMGGGGGSNPLSMLFGSSMNNTGGNPLSMLMGGIQGESFGPSMEGQEPFGPFQQKAQPSISPLQLLTAAGSIKQALQDRSIEGSLTPKEIIDDLRAKQAKDEADRVDFMNKFNNPQPFRRQTANPV